MKLVKIHVHKDDLPDSVELKGSVAIDTETLGLNPHRDRLCLVQLSDGSGVCHLVQISRDVAPAPNLLKILNDPKILKLFHYGRFDIAILYKTFGVLTTPVYCTKIASRLTRNFTSKHGLKNLCSELLDIEISKQARASDWGQRTLAIEQQNYAATDVLHLHELKEKLDVLLDREGRTELAQACFDFLPTCAKLDLLGYVDLDLFNHS